jgi:hypothetical protein
MAFQLTGVVVYHTFGLIMTLSRLCGTREATDIKVVRFVENLFVEKRPNALSCLTPRIGQIRACFQRLQLFQIAAIDSTLLTIDFRREGCSVSIHLS